MPTRLRRINVTCDPELEAAMASVADLLDERSEAGRLRALALAGARSLAAGTGASVAAARASLVRRGDVEPARNDDRRLPWLDERPDEQRPASAALEWVRGEG